MSNRELVVVLTITPKAHKAERPLNEWKLYLEAVLQPLTRKPLPAFSDVTVESVERKKA